MRTPCRRQLAANAGAFEAARVEVYTTDVRDYDRVPPGVFDVCADRGHRECLVVATANIRDHFVAVELEAGITQSDVRPKPVTVLFEGLNRIAVAEVEVGDLEIRGEISMISRRRLGLVTCLLMECFPWLI